MRYDEQMPIASLTPPPGDLRGGARSFPHLVRQRLNNTLYPPYIQLTHGEPSISKLAYSIVSMQAGKAFMYSMLHGSGGPSAVEMCLFSMEER